MPHASHHHGNEQLIAALIDDKVIMESIVLCEKFMRECIIEPAFDAPMLTTPKRRMPWPRFDYVGWQRLLRRFGSTVTTP